MISPYFRKTTNKITSIEIIIKRDTGAEQIAVFVDHRKIKDLIESEKFFKDMSEL